MRKSVRLVVASLLILGQSFDMFAAQAAPSVQTTTPAKLNLVIVEGDGAINNIQQRVAREVIVQVNDENNRPVGGAVIAFALPASGPGGTFANGTNLLTVTTDASGRATAGFTPNSVAGSFRVTVNASFQGQTATAVVAQTNALAAAGAGATAAGAGAGAGGGISGSTIALIAVVAGAAVTTGAVIATQKNGDKNPPAASTPTIRICSGTPTLGAPGFTRSIGLPKTIWK